MLVSGSAVDGSLGSGVVPDGGFEMGIPPSEMNASFADFQVGNYN